MYNNLGVFGDLGHGGAFEVDVDDRHLGHPDPYELVHEGNERGSDCH